MVKEAVEMLVVPPGATLEEKNRISKLNSKRRRRAGLIKPKLEIPGLKSVPQGASSKEKSIISSYNYRLRKAYSKNKKPLNESQLN